MNKDIEKLIVLAMDLNCENNLGKVCELLKQIFDADEIRFSNLAVVNRNSSLDNTIYLPILINGKMTCRYEIINPKKEVDKSISNLLVSVLSKMHSNILKQIDLINDMRTDKQTGLYSKDYFTEYCYGFSNNLIRSMHCIFVDVNGLKDINNEYGYDAGNILIKMVADEIRRIFSSSCDIAFRVGGDKFVIFIKNDDLVSTNERIKGLKENLANNDISISCGLAIDLDNIDLINLIKLAYKRMRDDKNSYYFDKERNR